MNRVQYEVTRTALLDSDLPTDCSSTYLLHYSIVVERPCSIQQHCLQLELFVVKVISVGKLHTCSILNDGHLMCWGCDTNGQVTVPAGHLWQVITSVSSAMFTCLNHSRVALLSV